MSYYPISKDNKNRYRILVNPLYRYEIYDGESHLNGRRQIAGKFETNVGPHPLSDVNLYELNPDKDFDGSSNEPFTGIETKLSLSKNSQNFSQQNYENLVYGQEIQVSLEKYNGIRYNYFRGSDDRAKLAALHSYFDEAKLNQPSLDFSNVLTEESLLIEIPSIMTGAQIERRTISLSFYYSGSLIGSASDSDGSGALWDDSGSIIGVVLYSIGMIYINSPIELSTDNDYYDSSTSTERPKWIHFGRYQSLNPTESSYVLEFRGSEELNVFTCYLDLPKGELNNSLNPTFVQKTSYRDIFSSKRFVEASKEVVNVSENLFQQDTNLFEKDTYVSRVILYDKDKKPLAVASMAKPLRKKESRSYTLKLKLDF